MHSRTMLAVAAAMAAFALTACSKQDAVGKWRDPKGGTVEFLSDGNLILADRSIGQITGKWRTIEGNRIGLTMGGLFALAGEMVCRWKRDGSGLTLSECPLNGTLTKSD